MAAPGYRITLISPALDEYDVYDRVSVEDLGTVSEELEKDLLELVHGDYDVTLDNSDGFFDTLWNALTLAETWTIRVERERLGRRATWENIFAGVLNLPWSIRFNRNARTVELQAFSWSKLLSRTQLRLEPTCITPICGHPYSAR